VDLESIKEGVNMMIHLSRRLHSKDGSGYSVQKEVGMHNVIFSVFGIKSFRLHLTLVLAVLLLVVPVLSANAQADSFKDKIFGTLIALPDEDFAALVDLTTALNESEELINLLMEAPREFLLNEGIDLQPDAFQITGVNLLLPSAVEDEPWFGIAEPLEGLVFDSKGLGVFYGNVAVFIQRAFEPVEEGTERPSLKDEMFLFITDDFVGDTLDLVRNVIRSLDEMDPEDPGRLEFLANPREYLIGQNLTLPARTYRIIAIDLNRAEAAGSVVSDVIRPGLGTNREGIGVFYNNVGIFLQQAI
jgi:hypothetical protein